MVEPSGALRPHPATASVAAKAPAMPFGPAESCGDFGIRIDRAGTWYYHDSPIGRMPLVKLFASVLRREADGYWLVTPAERGRIEVEDVPFVAVELTVLGSGTDQILSFRTNIDEIVEADADHPLRVETDPADATPRPYVLVRGGLEARLARPVFYQLVELGSEIEHSGQTVLGVWSHGQFFPLGSLSEPG